MAEFGLIDRPSYHGHELYETVGYVTQIWVEQETTRDSLYFMLDIYVRSFETPEHSQICRVHLDVGTTVALAQLQLLRDALYARDYLVKIHFNFEERDEKYANVYWLGVLRPTTGPVTVREYYELTGMPTPVWYFHFPREG